MRKCIEVVVRGLRLRGVVHLPPAAELQSTKRFEGLGVVMLHPGFLPRSGMGDAVVALADGLARNGVLTVRMDLAGLGDSEGDLAETAIDFVGALQEGEFAEPARECVQAVKAHLGLQRVVVGGYCGGAITGLFMAASQRHELPAGLFALETSFQLVTSAEPAAAKGKDVPAAERRRAKLEKLKSAMDCVISATSVGRALLKAYRVPRNFLFRRRKNPAMAQAHRQLPPEANLKLMQAIDAVLRTPLPLLLVTAEEASKQARFDYVEYALADYPGRAVHRRIKNTDHSLAEGEGPARVLEYVTAWLHSEFGQPANTGEQAPDERSRDYSCAR